MRNSHQIDREFPKRFEPLIRFDMLEIDNPLPWHPRRLNYLHRIERILGLVETYVPERRASVADIGCAQGNVGLLLAEKGYLAWLVDQNADYLDYAKARWERGEVRYKTANIWQDRMDLQVDAVIAGELIEHCAYPEDIVIRLLDCLKPGGILILTTPNGKALGNRLPLFGEIASREARRPLEARQFGPDGSDHLFLFGLDDLDLILPKNAELLEKGYLGGIVLTSGKANRLLGERHCLRLFDAVGRLPPLNRKLIGNLFAVIRKMA